MAKAASRGKIANKINSKKNKGKTAQSTLNKAQKQKVGAKPTGQQQLLSKGALIKKTKQSDKSERQRVTDQMVEIAKRIKEDDDGFVLPDRDMLSSDEDEEESSMGFLDNLVDQHQIKKLEKERKRRLENLGEDFEVTKRSFVAPTEQSKKNLLPVMNPSTQRMEARVKILKGDPEEMIEENVAEVDETEDPNDRAVTAVDIVELQNEMKKAWPKRLANAAKRAMSNPEEHAHAALRCFLNGLSFDDEKKFMPLGIRQRAMLSAAIVVTDVLPGYKIAKLSEGQMKEKVKKELKQLRQYEQGLLELFQKYLMRVEYFIKLYKSPKQLNTMSRTMRRKQANDAEIDVLDYMSDAARLGMARTAAKVLSKLAISTMGFNYHENIVEAMVPLINDGDEQITEHVKEGIINLFRNDRLGDKTLKVVQTLAGLIRSKGPAKVKAECVEVLSRLKIKKVEQKGGKDEKDKERAKINRDQVSRAQNKQRKKEAKLAIEMKELQASENQQDRLHFNSQTIEAVFGIYFRILKSGRNTALLAPVLLGIGQFGHMINLDLIGPMLTLLEQVFSDGSIPVHSRLKAAKSACSILSGQGEDLLVDPKHLYQHTYQLLAKINTRPVEGVSDPWPIMLELLINLLVDRKAHLNSGRVNAFLHRIIITAQRVNVEKGPQSMPFVLPLLLVARQMLVHHRSCHACIDEEAELSARAVDETDPDLVVANRVSVVAELAKLAASGNMLIASVAKHIQSGAESKVALPKNMNRKKPADVYREMRYRK